MENGFLDVPLPGIRCPYVNVYRPEVRIRPQGFREMRDGILKTYVVQHYVAQVVVGNVMSGIEG